MKNKLSKEVDELMEKWEKLRTEIKKTVLELPDNPNIQRLNSNCFTVNSKEVFKHNNLSPEFYDFKKQYRLFLNKMENVSVVSFSDTIDNILETGTIRIYQSGQERVHKLHPDVIENIKKVWEK